MGIATSIIGGCLLAYVLSANRVPLTIKNVLLVQLSVALLIGGVIICCLTLSGCQSISRQTYDPNGMLLTDVKYNSWFSSVRFDLNTDDYRLTNVEADPDDMIIAVDPITRRVEFKTEGD